MLTDMLDKIEQHFNHACTKHPGFVDDMSYAGYKTLVEDDLDFFRKMGDYEKLINHSLLHTVLHCEIAEFEEAIANGKFKEAIEEGYDIIAVVLRAIERIKKQKLGDSAKGGGE